MGTAHDFHVSRQDLLDFFPPCGRISLPPFIFFFFLIVLKTEFCRNLELTMQSWQA